jgi:hypothetical protein
MSTNKKIMLLTLPQDGDIRNAYWEESKDESNHKLAGRSLELI